LPSEDAGIRDFLLDFFGAVLLRKPKSRSLTAIRTRRGWVRDDSRPWLVPGR